MRFRACLALLCFGIVPALAQAPAPAPAKPPTAAEAYAAMTPAERMAIQSDLVWTGHYAGIVDGEFGNRSVAGVRAFQKAAKGAETGILTPRERTQLAAQAKAKQEQAGWRTVEDAVTGAILGLPMKLVPRASRDKDGARWTSASRDVLIETFRMTGPEATLAKIAEQQRAVADRKVEYSVMRPDFFVLTGSQGARKFYIRAQAKDQEVRGFAVSYDAAKDAEMQPITVAVSNAFTAFPVKVAVQPAGPPPRRKVEYTTGLVVSAAGHVVADRLATEGCRVIQIPPLGPAERVGEDAATGLALLRIYGAGDLRPAALVGEASGDTVTLVGIADPSAQGGGGAISTPQARLTGTAAEPIVDPAPALGFSGAPAIDGRGRIRGIVLVRPQVVAGPASGEQPALVPVEVVQKFLQARQVTPATASASASEIRAAVVRVICVRP